MCLWVPENLTLLCEFNQLLVTWEMRWTRFASQKLRELRVSVLGTENYSGGSNTERSKTKSIRKTNVSKFGFQMVKKMGSLGRFIYWNNFFKRPRLAMVRFLNGPDHSKMEQNGPHFIKNHSKTEPFENRTDPYHPKSEHVRYSSPHCIPKAACPI